MVQALAISSVTLNRASVISYRTQSEEIGIIKAMMIENLKSKLHNGVAHFIFVKKNGEVKRGMGNDKRSTCKSKNEW